jgi:hypothetical protein
MADLRAVRRCACMHVRVSRGVQRIMCGAPPGVGKEHATRCMHKSSPGAVTLISGVSMRTSTPKFPTLD